MLEQLLIFTRGGLILWTCKELGNALKGSPIDALIRSCLLEERSADSSYNYDGPGASYTLKWTFHNDLGLIFVAVYQKILHLLYIDDLLSMVKREFSQIYDPKRIDYEDFDDTFRQLRKEAKARAEEMKKSKQSVRLSKKQAQIAVAQKAGSQGGGKQNSGGSGGGKDDADGDSAAKGRAALENGNSNGNLIGGIKTKSRENGSVEGGAFDVSKLKKMRAKTGKKTDTTVVIKAPKVEPKKKITKKNRVWDDSPVESKLDFTDPVDEKGDVNVEVVAADHGESMMDKEEIVSSESEDEEDEEVNATKTNTKKKGWFSSVFQR